VSRERGASTGSMYVISHNATSRARTAELLASALSEWATTRRQMTGRFPDRRFGPPCTRHMSVMSRIRLAYPFSSWLAASDGLHLGYFASN
jgi:hypothetical protein